MENAIRSIRVSEIRTMMNAALAALEAAGVEEISLENDAYWSVPSEDAFDLTKSPELDVGVIDDDIGDLRSDMEHMVNDEGVAVWHLFHHLRGVVLLLARYSQSRLI